MTNTINVINEKFFKNIKEYNMIKKGDKIIAAVSGGADSIFMLHNLHLYREKEDFCISVAHVNHGIRETAKRDEEFVRHLCENLGLEFNVTHVDMHEYATLHGMTDEEAGRYLRYSFFRKLKGKNGKIFLAHNANDQAETVFQRIIRGTGVDGLSAMDYVKNDLFRPILNVKRSEIIDYLYKNDIKYVEDETNSMDIYGRNKIRLKVIPYIEDNFNEGFVDSLLRLSELSKKNMNYVKDNVDNYLKNHYKNNTLDTEALKNENSYFISEVVRAFLKEQLKSIHGIFMNNIDEIAQAIASGTKLNITLKNNINLVLSYDSLYIDEKSKNVAMESEMLIEGINNTSYGEFIIKSNSNYEVSRNCISIDADKLKGNLYIRYRKNGDRFKPIGMENKKKLKDFFIDEKIPRNIRDKTPILCDDEEIVWVAPYRMSENYKVDKNTKNIINICMEDTDGKI
ncbi:tRNA(Ile)-lysidine synthase (tRNA(Ile)-lysidinesynthetase) [Peptoniphilus sp. ING2-D1G]|nr:tRNA(Ile)-lysidine synthase (tRNA(Ile)-lysidinesynthetase) [Peptoniphilus sp. ING2-D1G]